MAKNTFNRTLADTAKVGIDASEIEVIDEILDQELPPKPEQTIPLSQVNDYIDQQLEKRLLQINQEKPKEIPLELSPKKVEASDELPEFAKWEIKDRIYVLCTGYSSISHGIKDRHKRNSPLMYKGRALRYSTSQASFFMDKQVGDVLISYISIEDGKLMVPKENAHLQKFLAIHPDNNIVFKEHNPQQESKAIYDAQNIKLDAHLLSREIDTASLEAIAMLMCSNYLESWDIYTVKRQLYNEIEANPKLFIKLANDKTLKFKSIGKIAVFRGLISYRDFRFYNENGTVICESNREENEYIALAAYFNTNEGRNLYDYLVRKIES